MFQRVGTGPMFGQLGFCKCSPVNTLSGFYAAEALVGIENFPLVTGTLARFPVRPEVVCGLDLPQAS